MQWKQLFSPAPEMTADEARAYMAGHSEGTYTLIDVRQPKEYEQEHIPGARLMPLPDLSGRLAELERDQPYLVYCAVGGRSRAAAQLMQGQGFTKVHNLKGGIKAWNGMKARGPAEQGMGLLSGGEGPAQVLAVAHALEKNLGDFYRDLADRAPSPETQETFGRLAEAEDKHLASIVEAFRAETGQDQPPEVNAGSMLEGGMQPQDLLQRFSEVQGPAQTLYQMAMELEAQALDLYLRYGRVMTTDPSRAVLLGLADEEKTHLTWLGRMLEQAV